MQLRDDELDVVPLRQLVAGHAHCRRGSMVAGLAQTVRRKLADEFDVRLVRGTGGVLVGALV